MKKELTNSWRFDNIYAVVVSFITIVFSVSALYWGLSSKIDLLTQKVEMVIQNQEVYIQAENLREIRVRNLEKEVAVLQSRGE